MCASSVTLVCVLKRPSLNLLAVMNLQVVQNQEHFALSILDQCPKKLHQLVRAERQIMRLIDDHPARLGLIGHSRNHRQLVAYTSSPAQICLLDNLNHANAFVLRAYDLPATFVQYFARLLASVFFLHEQLTSKIIKSLFVNRAGFVADQLKKTRGQTHCLLPAAFSWPNRK